MTEISQLQADAPVPLTSAQVRGFWAAWVELDFSMAWTLSSSRWFLHLR